jgi:hypothetical protein
MLAILHLLGTFVANLFKSQHRLELENLFLRHQLNIALRRAPHLRLRGDDRALLVWMTRLWPTLLGLSRVVQPDTILRWHRAGFRSYWRWKSRGRAGRPKVSRELRELIRRMNIENPLWGAPRIGIGRGSVYRALESAGEAGKSLTCLDGSCLPGSDREKRVWRNARGCGSSWIRAGSPFRAAER